MTNDDLKRFYNINNKPEQNKDFVRYDDKGNIHVGIPVNAHDAASKQFVEEAIQAGGDPTTLINFDILSTEASSPIISTDDGFEISYENDGHILLPIEGTEDIVIDIDEENKKINFHLDASLRSKLSRMLVSPVSNPSETTYVAISSTGAQTLVPASNYIDIGNLYITHSDGTAIPTFTMEMAHNIYQQITSGLKNEIKWAHDNAVVIIEVNQVDFDVDTYFIQIIFDNTYAITYSWGDGDSNVTVEVKKFAFEV